MTAPDKTEGTSVCILIDGWIDGIVEEVAWVKVTSVTDTEEKALAKLEVAYPADEQADGGESLSYEGRSKQYLRPVGTPDETGLVRVQHGDGSTETYQWPEVPWSECQAESEGAQEFWRFEVVEHG